jgi:hypothetical protein
MHPYAYYIAI